jgi:hypothetical protein
MTVLLQLADQEFLVRPETARRVEQAIPADRSVMITPVREVPTLQLGQKQKSSVFDRHQPELTDKEKEQTARFARHLSKAEAKSEVRAV